MTGISWRPVGAASCLCVALAACGGRAGSGTKVEPSTGRVIPLASAIVLETAGPPPSDTALTFLAGEPRVVVLRHGPPENVVFAEVSFAANTLSRRQRVTGQGRDPAPPGRVRAGPPDERAVQRGARPSSSSTPGTSPRRPRRAPSTAAMRVRARAGGRPAAGHRAVAVAAPLDPTRPPTICRRRSPPPGTYLVAAPQSP